MENLPTINAALIKVTGVFNFSKKRISVFVNDGYDTIPLSENFQSHGQLDSEKARKENIESTKKWYRDITENFHL